MPDPIFERYKEALKAGHVAVLRGRPDEAIGHYREAAEIAPERPLPHTSLGGVLLLGVVTAWRTVATTGMGFWDISVPLMVMGLGLPFFFIPTTGLAMASVDEAEMANAAGLMNFLRTLSGAFATSMVTTAWQDQTTRQHAELVGLADADNSVR